LALEELGPDPIEKASEYLERAGYLLGRDSLPFL
jgi:hypothetical protein